MIVPAGLDLDVPILSQGFVVSDIYLNGAGADGEYVDESLPGPGLYVESVYTTALDVSGDSHGKKIGTSSALCPLEERDTKPADELGQVIPELPLTPWRKAGGVACKIDLNAVKIIVFCQVSQDLELVVL